MTTQVQGFRIAFAAALVLAGLGQPAAAQSTQWRSGSIVYTPLVDQLGNFQSNGTGYFVSQAYISSPPQPTVGQRFYLSVYLSAIASPPVGRLMFPHLQLPAGVSVVADPAVPLLDLLLARADARDVRMTMVDGRVLYRDGRFPHLDPHAIAAAAADAARTSRAAWTPAREAAVTRLVAAVRDYYAAFVA